MNPLPRLLLSLKHLCASILPIMLVLWNDCCPETTLWQTHLAFIGYMLTKCPIKLGMAIYDIYLTCHGYIYGISDGNKLPNREDEGSHK